MEESILEDERLELIDPDAFSPGEDWGNGARRDRFKISVESPPSGDDHKTVAKATISETGEDVYLTTWIDENDPRSPEQLELGAYLTELQDFSNREDAAESLLPIRSVVRTRSQWCVAEKIFDGVPLSDFLEKTEDLELKSAMSIVEPIARAIDEMAAEDFRHGILDPDSVFFTGCADFAGEGWKSGSIETWKDWKVIFSGLALPGGSELPLVEKFPRFLRTVFSNHVALTAQSIQLIEDAIDSGMGSTSCQALLKKISRVERAGKFAPLLTSARGSAKKYFVPGVVLVGAIVLFLVVMGNMPKSRQDSGFSIPNVIAKKPAEIIDFPVGPLMENIDPEHLVFFGLPASQKLHATETVDAPATFRDRVALYDFFRSSPVFRDQAVRLGSELYQMEKAPLDTKLSIAHNLWEEYRIAEALKWAADHTESPDKKHQTRWEYFQISKNPDYRDAAKFLADDESIPHANRARFAWEYFSSLPKETRTAPESLGYLLLAISGNVDEAINYNKTNQLLSGDRGKLSLIGN